jgi:hypothetical protein
MNNKIQDKYGTKPRLIKPIFIRAIEDLGQLQIDVGRIETTPYYLISPWSKNRYEQIDQSLCAIPKRSSSIRLRAKTAKILKEKYNEHIKIYTNSSKKDEKVGCTVITQNPKFRKRLKPQNHKSKVIKTDSLSTKMAIERDINSKIPKLLDHSENYWTKKEKKSPFSGCQAIWEYLEMK